MKRVVLIFAALGFSQIALGDDLCLPKEKVVFSGAPFCEPNNAISVCLDKEGNNTLRYGNTDDTLIEFEAEIERCSVMYSGGGGLELTFSNENHRFRYSRKTIKVCFERDCEKTHEQYKSMSFRKDGESFMKQCSLQTAPKPRKPTYWKVGWEYLPPSPPSCDVLYSGQPGA